MRLIKFRAWDKENNIMVYDVEKPINLGIDKIFFHHFLQDVFEIMQYTGLKDKNGVEIYESDICRHQQLAGGLLEPNPAKNVQIVWTELHNGWICDDGKYRYSMQSSQLEVIGNIYQNKDLLK